MIVSKCPLRVSLAGGSTDLQAYLDKYGQGSVISFSINRYSYIILKERFDTRLRIVYSHVEDISDYHDVHLIKNEIVRETLKTFPARPMDIIFESDIPSSGSGLASSSAHTIALVKALSLFHNKPMDQLEVCEVAHKIELNVNPLTGYQDPYGCGLGGLRRLFFDNRGVSAILPLDGSVFNNIPMYIIPTASTRVSTNILKSLDLDKCHELLQYVDKIEKYIKDQDLDLLCDCINVTWSEKKATSPEIVTKEVQDTEDELVKFPFTRAIKLCGAGGGGYFFLMAKSTPPLMHWPINIDTNGVTASII
jgi:D-glycero-alpha-D-manno-heptose-7-phosphate kinase